MRKFCRICNLLENDEVGSKDLKMHDIFSEEDEVSLATLMHELANIQISCEDGRSQHICLDCTQQVRIGHRIWKKIRDAELRPHPVVSDNVGDALDAGIKLEQIIVGEDSSENKDGYLYEFLEDEFITDYGSNSDVSKALELQHKDTVGESKSTADNILSSENYKKSSQQRTFRKLQFEMPNEQVVVRVNDLLDHLIIEVKGDRCCGCSFVGANRRELLQHSNNAHSIEIEGTGNYCPICFYKFATESSLTKHLDECKSKSIFVCKNCEKYFNRQRQIEAHLQNCKKTDINCKTADELVVSTDGEYDSDNLEFLLSESGNESNGGMLSASDGDRRSEDNDWDTLMDQIELPSGRASSRSKTNSKSKINLSDVIDCHGVQASQIPDSQVVRRVTFEAFQYLKLKGERCCGCDFTCSKREQLFEHVEKTHAQNINLSEDFICPICYRLFVSENELSKHINFITSKDLLICSICDEAFCGTDTLNQHRQKSEKHKQNLLNSCCNQEKSEQMHTELINEDVLKLFEVELANGKTKEKARTRNSVRSITKHRHLTMPDKQFIAQIDEYNNYQVITVTGERCCGCGQFFETYNDLLQHGRQIHLIDNADAVGEYQCIICFARFECVRGLLMHQSSRKSVKKLFHCKICNLLFSKQFTISKHLQTAPNHLGSMVDCALENNAAAVQLEQKQDIAEALILNERRKLVKLNATAANKFVCCFPKCAKEFSSESLLLEHCSAEHSGKRRENESERTSESNVCPGCYKSFENATCLVWHRFTRFTKQYQCRFCDQTFTRWPTYREHENTVHLGKPTEFPCETCGKVFRTAPRLKAHSEVHSGLRKHVCSDCGASFRNKGVLKRHRRAVHSNDFPFDCKQCPKKFPTQEQLNAHSRVHTGAKPYVCRFCERAFSHFTDRKRHEMSTHTGERPHQCIYCPAAYVRNRELIIHMQKHEEVL